MRCWGRRGQERPRRKKRKKKKKKKKKKKRNEEFTENGDHALIVYVCVCVLNVRYVLKMERTVVG